MAYNLLTVFLLIHILLNLLFYFVVGSSLKNQNWFKRLGLKLLKTKEQQLNTNPLLKAFSVAINSQRINKARLIICSLILVKCIGMLLLGVIGLSLIIVPLQALMMAALVQQTTLIGISEADLLKVSGFQLAAMTIATGLGNFLGWNLFIDHLSLKSTIDSNIYFVAFMIGLTVIYCWFTALKEVRFYQVNKTLIG